MEADVTGVGAIAGDNQHLLPVAGIATAAGLQVMAMALELIGALQESGCGLGEFRAALQPGLLGDSEVPQVGQPLKRSGACRWAALQFQHRQGLIEGGMEGALTQIVGGNEAVTAGSEHA